MIAAGATGLVIEAGRTLLVEKEKLWLWQMLTILLL